jgi:hypothetical protein
MTPSLTDIVPASNMYYRGFSLDPIYIIGYDLEAGWFDGYNDRGELIRTWFTDVDMVNDLFYRRTLIKGRGYVQSVG